MRYITPILCTSIAALAAYAQAGGPNDRDIQMTSVTTDTAVIQLTNLGEFAVDLDGWRFCSQNTTVVRRYTATSGLNGTTLDPKESLFIYLNNDAPATANHVDVSVLGGTFAAMDLTAYAVSLYADGKDGIVSFGSPDDMADHIQFSMNGLNNFTADERTDEAVAAGLWTALTDWIALSPDSTGVALTDLSSGLLHGPSDYDVLPLPCAADFMEDGVLDIFDVLGFIEAFNASDPSADFMEDSVFDIFDVLGFISAFNAGCP